MFRSILKGSLLAASFCVIALSSSAQAKSMMSLSHSGDPGLKETRAGAEYDAKKKAGEVCPFATKGNRADDTSPTQLASVGGKSSDRDSVQ